MDDYITFWVNKDSCELNHAAAAEEEEEEEEEHKEE